MIFFNRKDGINKILDFLDIPMSEGFIIHHPKPGIGPFDGTYFERVLEIRREAETNALNDINQLDDEEIYRLCEEPKALDHYAFMNGLIAAPAWYGGGFDVPGRQARFGDWLLMGTWSIEETTCLSIGFEPQSFPAVYKDIPIPPGPLTFFWERHEIIRRAKLHKGEDPNAIEPEVFLNWVRKKAGAFEVPAELQQAINNKADPAFISRADQRELDSLKKIAAALLVIAYGENVAADLSEPAKDIENQLDFLGLSLTRKTIIKHLNTSLHVGGN